MLEVPTVVIAEVVVKISADDKTTIVPRETYKA